MNVLTSQFLRISSSSLCPLKGEEEEEGKEGDRHTSDRDTWLISKRELVRSGLEPGGEERRVRSLCQVNRTGTKHSESHFL